MGDDALAQVPSTRSTIVPRPPTATMREESEKPERSRSSKSGAGEPSSAVVGSKAISAGGTAGVRDKSDMILYTRNFGGATGNAPSVECGSCHDPHVEEATGTPAAGKTFLRIANTGSAVCLACHNK